MTIALQYHIKSILKSLIFLLYWTFTLPSQSAVPKICFYFTPHFSTYHSSSLQHPLSHHHCLSLLKKKLYNIVVYIKQITKINSLNPSTTTFFFQRPTEKLKVSLSQFPQQIITKPGPESWQSAPEPRCYWTTLPLNQHITPHTHGLTHILFFRLEAERQAYVLTDFKIPNSSTF